MTRLQRRGVPLCLTGHLLQRHSLLVQHFGVHVDHGRRLPERVNRALEVVIVKQYAMALRRISRSKDGAARYVLAAAWTSA